MTNPWKARNLGDGDQSQTWKGNISKLTSCRNTQTSDTALLLIATYHHYHNQHRPRKKENNVLNMFYDQNTAPTQAKGERDPEHTRTQRWWGRRQGSRLYGVNLNKSDIKKSSRRYLLSFVSTAGALVAITV